jgi:UDP-2,3-diacylglucosamine hydrolase
MLANLPYTLFISDLHLDENEPEIFKKFLVFIEQYAMHADCIYILGDFFEMWIGEDKQNLFLQTVSEKLRQLSQVKPVYFMPGNRDFLIDHNFAEKYHLQILHDPSCINLYGKKILLMHGDSLCTQDKSHQLFRKITQHPFTKKIFLSLPLFLRKKIGALLRGKSKQRTHQLQEHVMDVTPIAVTQALHFYDTDLLIHGHTHKPAIHPHQTSKGMAKRVVLGAWHSQGNMLVYSADGCYELINF